MENNTIPFFEVGKLYTTIISYKHRNYGTHDEKTFHSIKANTPTLCVSVTECSATLFCHNDKNETVELVWNKHVHIKPYVFFHQMIDSE